MENVIFNQYLIKQIEDYLLTNRNFFHERNEKRCRILPGIEVRLIQLNYEIMPFV